MKSFIVNHQNYSMGLHNPIGEVFTKPSKTVPGMTMSLEELLARYVRGDSVATFQPVYSDDPDMPDVERMDPMERLDLARGLKQGILEFQEDKKQKAVDKKAQRLKDQVDERFRPDFEEKTADLPKEKG